MKKYLEWAALAGVIYIFIKYLSASPEGFWIEAWFMLEILILTTLTRTISAKNSLFIYTQGLVIGAGAMLLIGSSSDFIGFNISRGLWGNFFIPTLEEIVKLLPVLLAGYLVIKRDKTIFNISDFLLLAVMSGAGFSMLEKYFWGEINFSFTYGPHLGSLYFFSDALGVYLKGETVGYLGHAAATGFIGMGIGLGLYLKKHKPSTKAWWWIIPLATFAWVTFEHIIYNLRNDLSSAFWFKGMIITPWLFMLLLAATLVIEGRALDNLFKKFPSIKKQTFDSFKETFKNLKKGELSFFKIWTPFRKLRLANLLARRIK